MRRSYAISLIAGALASLATIGALPAGAQSSGVRGALPGWLAGAWQSADGLEWAEEVWNAPRGGIMQGMGRAGAGPQVQLWESMRIVVKPDGTLSFFAQPKGAAATEFPAASIGEEAIEFANPGHGYPQRIRYWRQGQLLMAEIARIDGSDAQRWNFRPALLGQ